MLVHEATEVLHRHLEIGSPKPRSLHAMALGKTGTYEPEADADYCLVARCQEGDKAAFGELIQRHQRTVYGIVSRMICNREDAEDLVQDIFVNAYRAIRSFRGQAKFSTWLHSIAVNMVLKRLKKLRRRAAVSIDDPPAEIGSRLLSESEESPDEVVLRNEQAKAIRRAIDNLPDKQKIVIVMYYFERLSCDEIADILKCSVGTVWSRLHYGCRKLRAELHWLERGY